VHFLKKAQKAQKAVVVAHRLVRFPPDCGCIRRQYR
jgi:hypothetical protein